jgi:hypothetical protein
MGWLPGRVQVFGLQVFGVGMADGGHRRRGDRCTTKRKTDMLKTDARRREGLVRSCEVMQPAGHQISSNYSSFGGR